MADKPKTDKPALVGIAAAAPSSQLPRPDQPSAEARAPLRHESCGGCSCGDFAPNADMGVCRAKAPEHFMFIVPRQVVVQGEAPFEPKSWSQWPFVRKDNWCIHDFRPKPETVN